MNMFKTGGFSKNVIESVEVVKCTPKKVYFNVMDWNNKPSLRSELKVAEYHQWHDSWDAAHAYLIKEANGRLESAKRQVDICRSRLQTIQALKPNVPT